MTAAASRPAPQRAGAALAQAVLAGSMLQAAALVTYAQAPDAPAGGRPYTDRLLDGGALEPDVSDAGPSLGVRNTEGWPRSLSIEVRGQTQRSTQAGRTDAAYTIARATLDTPNHGALSVDLSRRLVATGGPSDGAAASAAALTLSQRQMPLGDGWLGSHFLGAINTLNTDLANRSLRHALPTRRLMNGAAAHWESRADGLALLGAAGQPGVPGSLGQGGLAEDGPPVRMVGLQRSGPAFGYAAQVAESGPLPADQAGTGVVGRSWWQSLRWQGEAGTVQAHWLNSRGDAGHADGGWFDAGSDAGPVSHRLGGHHLPAGLHWLALPLGGGTRGAYYRWRWQSRRDIMETQVDLQQPLDDGGSSRQFWWLGRRQMDLRDAVGMQFAGLASRGGGSWEAFLFTDRNRDSGIWRWFAGTGRAAGGARPAQAGVDWSQAWGDVRWSTSAAVRRQPEQARSLVDFAASVNGPVSGRLSLDAGLRAVTDTRGAAVSHSLHAGAYWTLGAGWSLSAAVSTDRSEAYVPPPGPSGTAPLLTPASPAATARFAWLSLRYDFAAGSPELPLGGSGTGGGGRVEGVVYLDANANGRLDPAEQRASGVTVLLDGRFMARTDPQGRFEFAFVASGEHHLTVLNDTLPLPWHAPSGPDDRTGAPARIGIRVSARQTTRVEVGALQGTD